MTYFHWLGRDAEEIHREEEEATYFCQEVKARQLEDDGFITLYPKFPNGYY